MEFLVRIDVTLPGDMPEERRAALLADELVRGRVLRAQGVIKHIWRVPGAIRNVGVWEARNATELHERISNLPLFPWIHAEVTALARHPVDEAE